MCCSFHAGLSIDYEKEQLYWISSGNGTINRCRLDGSKLEILEGVKGKLTKATALAIMGKLQEIVLLLMNALHQNLGLFQSLTHIYRRMTFPHCRREAMVGRPGNGPDRHM